MTSIHSQPRRAAGAAAAPVKFDRADSADTNCVLPIFIKIDAGHVLINMFGIHRGNRKRYAKFGRYRCSISSLDLDIIHSFVVTGGSSLLLASIGPQVK